MTIAGRAIGFCLGALTRNPLMIAIGLGVGYVVDLYLDRRPQREADKPDDPYETLGIPRDASDDDVDRAYRRLMGQYHPDKVAGAADEIRRLAEQRATAINLAYESIQKRRRRR